MAETYDWGSSHRPIEGHQLPHNTSGLPPLNLEPFDPTTLYAAASSPRPDTGRARPGARWAQVLAALGLAVVTALIAGAALLVS